MIRAVPRYYDHEEQFFNKKLNVIESKQMLLTGKMGRVFVNGGKAFFYWAWWLMNDITLLELILRKKDPMEYGYDKHWENDP